MKKVCVLNYSGNVGKSIVSKHIIQTIIPDARLVQVETRNATEEANNSVKLNAQYFDKIQEEILIEDKVILDVGSSNIDEFIEGVDKFAGSLDDFDLFVVPVVSDEKIQKDSIQTIILLIEELNVPKEKIRIIFNRTKTNVDEEFRAFIGACNELGIKYDLRAVMPETDLFTKMKEGDTLTNILNDKTDYKTLIKKEKSRSKKLAYSRKLMLPMMARSIQEKVDNIEEYLNG